MKCSKCGCKIPDRSLIAKILKKCPFCGALLNGARGEKVGKKPTTYPDGVPIFPDDVPCPKCGYHTVLLHSHGDIALECPKCDWCKTVNDCMAEKVSGTVLTVPEERGGCSHAENWKNKEGYFKTPEGRIVCLDWDDFCTKCADEQKVKS